MFRSALYFIGPQTVAIREEALPPLVAGQVLVKTLYSAISPGTESLVYRGQFPDDLTLDENIASLSGKFGYPLKYGYSAVGQVIELGSGVDRSWEGKWAFCFNPHESHFIVNPEQLLLLPDDLTPEEAVFLPNMETALNFVMDAGPMIGEQVLVFGQGIVGLLTTALLVRFPLGRLITVDRFPLRRQASLDLGAHASFDPDQPETRQQLGELLQEGADLTLELSGAPEALDKAIALTGFAGRVIIGSWYGQKPARLELGGRFHRSRIQLISSQVSTLAPHLSGRWTKARRFESAWTFLRGVRPARFITQRFLLQDAAQAYQLIDEHPEQTIQVVLTYE